MARSRLSRHVLRLLGFVELIFQWECESITGPITLEVSSDSFRSGPEWLETYSYSTTTGATYGVWRSNQGPRIRAFFVTDTSVAGPYHAALLDLCFASDRKSLRVEQEINAQASQGRNDMLRCFAWRPASRLRSFYSTIKMI